MFFCRIPARGVTTPKSIFRCCHGEVAAALKFISESIFDWFEYQFPTSLGPILEQFGFQNGSQGYQQSFENQSKNGSQSGPGGSLERFWRLSGSKGGSWMPLSRFLLGFEAVLGAKRSPRGCQVGAQKHEESTKNACRKTLRIESFLSPVFFIFVWRVIKIIIFLKI